MRVQEEEEEETNPETFVDVVAVDLEEDALEELEAVMKGIRLEEELGGKVKE